MSRRALREDFAPSPTTSPGHPTTDPTDQPPVIVLVRPDGLPIVHRATTTCFRAPTLDPTDHTAPTHHTLPAVLGIRAWEAERARNTAPTPPPRTIWFCERCMIQAVTSNG